MLRRTLLQMPSASLGEKMKNMPTAIMMQTIMCEAAPTRTPALIVQKYSHHPINQMTAHALHHEAISIWEECRARGETLPHGNDLQCLLLIHRIASQFAQYDISVPDFLFLSVSEYEQALSEGRSHV